MGIRLGIGRRRVEMNKVGERMIKLEDICVQRKLVVGHVDGDHSNIVSRHIT